MPQAPCSAPLRSPSFSVHAVSAAACCRVALPPCYRFLSGTVPPWALRSVCILAGVSLAVEVVNSVSFNL